MFIGQLVPGSGDTLNGIFAAGQGISKETYSFPALGVAPRFGAAWDLTGNQHLVLRGGAGLFFDRPTNFQLTVNPPAQYNVTVANTTLQSLSTAQRVEGPPTLLVYQQDAKLPGSVQWNVGLQKTVLWADDGRRVVRGPICLQPIDQQRRRARRQHQRRGFRHRVSAVVTGPNARRGCDPRRGGAAD